MEAGSLEAGPQHQLGNGSIEGKGQSSQGENGYVVVTPFHPTDVGAIHLRSQSEMLLANSL